MEYKRIHVDEKQVKDHANGTKNLTEELTNNSWKIGQQELCLMRDKLSVIIEL